MTVVYIKRDGRLCRAEAVTLTAAQKAAVAAASVPMFEAEAKKRMVAGASAGGKAGDGSSPPLKRDESKPATAQAAKATGAVETAQKIHGRAIKRVGELLAAIEANVGGRPSKLGPAPTLVSPPTRKQAATDAGLSERQQKTALRVAAVPAEEFEAMIEQSPPATVTAIAAVCCTAQEVNIGRNVNAAPSQAKAAPQRREAAKPAAPRKTCTFGATLADRIAAKHSSPATDSLSVVARGASARATGPGASSR